MKFAIFSICSTFLNILDNYSNITGTQALNNNILIYSNQTIIIENLPFFPFCAADDVKPSMATNYNGSAVRYRYLWRSAIDR